MSTTSKGFERRDFLKLSGLAALGAAGIAAGCGGPGSSGSGGGGGALRMGALFPVSGSLALLGSESWRGVQVAQKLRNDDGGVAGREVEFVLADVPDVTAATSEARRLTTRESVDLVVGTYSSSLSLAASEVVARAEKTYFEMGAIAEDITTRGYSTVWRTNPTAADFTVVQLEFIRDWVAPEMDIDVSNLNLLIVHEDSSYGSSVASTTEKQAQKLGFAKPRAIPYDAEASDLSSVILNIKSAQPDVVIAVSYAEDAVLLGRQARENQLRVPAFIGTGGGHSLKSFVEGLGAAADGTFNVDFTQYNVASEFTPGLDAFLEQYRQQFDEEPRSGHSLANYMGANLLFDILAETDGSLDADEFAEAAGSMTKSPGSTATGWAVDFNDQNQNEKAAPFVTQWMNKEQQTVWPKDAAVSEPQLVTPFA